MPLSRPTSFLAFFLISCGQSPGSGTAAPTSTTPSNVVGTSTTATTCTSTWFADSDADGFGDPLVGSCTEQSGYVDNDADCDDGDGTVHPDAAEACDGRDNNCDTAIDELFDDLNDDGTPDCDETLIFCEGFEGTLDAWDYLGTGEWLPQYGAIHEERGGTYGAVMYTVDAAGTSDVFRIEGRTAFTGSLNDMAGLVWSVDPDASSYLVARWDDPQHDYARHQPPGAMEIVECTDEVTCPVVARDKSATLFWPADGTFVTWQVAVNHGQVTVTWDGQVVFDQYVYQAMDRGPGRVGLYSNDNDGGVQFDDFCVWITPNV